MGRSQRDKGARGERELVNYLLERNYPAFRDWQNGPGHPGDVLAVLDAPLADADAEKLKEVARAYGDIIEVKRRKKAWQELYRWIDGVDAVCIRADGNEWLIVKRLKDIL